MKLIPFFIQKQESTFLYVYKLTCFFTDGSRTLWDIDSTQSPELIEQEYLAPNGFVSRKIWCDGDFCYALLDFTKTKIESFYTWEETQADPAKKREDCFRSFIFCIQKEDKTNWYTSELLHKPIDSSVKDAFTPYSVFKGLKKFYGESI